MFTKLVKKMFNKLPKLISELSTRKSEVEKSNLIRDFVSELGDISRIIIWCKFLLPGQDGRKYNMGDKQLLLLCCKTFGLNYKQVLLKYKDTGVVCDTLEPLIKLPEESSLSDRDVDDFLCKMDGLNSIEERLPLMKRFTCTREEFLWVLKLLGKSLNIGIGPKIVLTAFSEECYKHFKKFPNIETVIRKFYGKETNSFEPVSPALAKPCRDFSTPFKSMKKIYWEMKYDGERVQVHKFQEKILFYSRNLKTVSKAKLGDVEEYILKVFNGVDVVLDGEILLVDNNTLEPLPFGTLGVNKRKDLNASTCIFIFDCLYLNGETLTSKGYEERRRVLKQFNMIPRHLTESIGGVVSSPEELKQVFRNSILNGWEGIMLKDSDSVYGGGSRTWYKMKKDYIEEFSMADTVDLIVLGAWKGTKANGGKYSSFLMGARLEDKLIPICKVGNGFSNADLERHQKLDFEERMIPPPWIEVGKMPDAYIKDPKEAPVWEITGAEFTLTEGRISIRFPRITRERHDKDFLTSTSYDEINELYRKSQIGIKKIRT